MVRIKQTTERRKPLGINHRFVYKSSIPSRIKTYTKGTEDDLVLPISPLKISALPPTSRPINKNTTIPPWFPGFERNSQVPEEHCTANWQVGIPTACSWNNSKFRSWLEISTTCTARFTRGGRVVCSRLVWWCEFMRYSRKKGYDHGTRFTACSKDSRRQAFLIGCDIFCRDFLPF